MTPLITLYNLGEGEWESADFAAYKEIKETGNDAISMAICEVMQVEIATYTLALRSNMPTPIGDKRGCLLVKASKNSRLGACSSYGSMCKSD